MRVGAVIFPPKSRAFVGRERELEALKLLVKKVRLLTITGPGGIGKTRLGLQLAAEVVQDFIDGCWFVPLAAVENATLIAQTVAGTLGVQQAPTQSIEESLVRDIADKHLLIVLDNAEHLLAGVASFTRILLAGCARAVVVITSREPTHIAGEHVDRIAPLAPVPATATLAEIETFDRTRLFLERARGIRHDLVIGENEVPALLSLCEKLEGIPLVIELAAARLSILSIKQTTNAFPLS